uniref:Protein SEC13 homolog n=1 Tax=Lygus hesperus TaxID=30085 RepID=A0A0A9W586_LYGHE
MVSLVCSIDTAHEDIVHDAEIDYYGLQLATCSSDNMVKIFGIKNSTQTLIADLKGHYGPVWQVSWAHPKFGNIIASCSYDRKVIIWKENQEWTKIYEYSNHDASVNSVKFGPHEYGLILACGSSDGAFSIISLNQTTGSWEFKKKMNAHAIGCNALSWCPDGKGPKRIVTGGCDSLVRVWEEGPNGWDEKAKLDHHSDWVRDVAWAPGITSNHTTIASCSQDRRVIIWTCSTGNNPSNFVPHILHTFDDAIWNLSWSITGNILAVSGGDNKVTLWKENSERHWTCISDVNKVQSHDQRQL